MFSVRKPLRNGENVAFSIINGTAPQAFSFLKNINKAGGGFHIVVEENIFCGKTNASGDRLYFLVEVVH